VGTEPTREQCRSAWRGEATRKASRHAHDFEKNVWPLFLNRVTLTSQRYIVTSLVGCKSVKELQYLASLFTYSFIASKSTHIGQKCHDTDRQARLYRGTRGLSELG
jgi:hypothetical protein